MQGLIDVNECHLSSDRTKIVFSSLLREKNGPLKATRNENGSRALDCAAILWILEFLFISILCFIEEFCAAWLIVVNH